MTIKRLKHRVVVEITADELITTREAGWLVKDMLDVAFTCTALSAHRSFYQKVRATNYRVMRWDKVIAYQQRLWKRLVTDRRRK